MLIDGKIFNLITVEVNPDTNNFYHRYPQFLNKILTYLINKYGFYIIKEKDRKYLKEFLKANYTPNSFKVPKDN